MYEHACVCVCVCIVLCNVYWCELMLDSKRYWMRNFFGRNPNNKVKLNLIEYKKPPKKLKLTEDKQSVMK